MRGMMIWPDLLCAAGSGLFATTGAGPAKAQSFGQVWLITNAEAAKASPATSTR